MPFLFVVALFLGPVLPIRGQTVAPAGPNSSPKPPAAAGDTQASNNSASPDADSTTVRIKHEQKELEGWNIQIDTRLLEPEHAELGEKVQRILANKLYGMTLLVPPAAVAHLREVPIWLDLDHPLKHLQYHPDAGWLSEHGYDVAMAKAVHIPQAHRLVDLETHYAQPWAVLHEMAHAYHDRVLRFDHEAIRQAYEKIVASKKYESVLHLSGRQRRHYALTNHKEFFAEMTECYFGTNDFYPFVRAELAEAEPELIKLLDEVWSHPPMPPAP